MSTDSVAIARRLFDRVSRVRDPSGRKIDALDEETMAAIGESFDPDIVVHEDPSFPEAGTYRGAEAAMDYFRQFSDSFDEFTFETEEIIDLGEDRALILFHVRTRGKGSGAVTEARPGWIFTLRGEKVATIEAFFDRNEALAATGLDPKRYGASP